MTSNTETPARPTTAQPRASRGRRVAGFWRRHGWLVIGLLWIVAIALGLAGFSIAARAVVRMAETGGLARLVDPDGDGNPVGAFDHLYIFPLLDRTCTPEAILGGASSH
jgi:hypothetical protein